jgi:hypothetical protein
MIDDHHPIIMEMQFTFWPMSCAICPQLKGKKKRHKATVQTVEPQEKLNAWPHGFFFSNGCWYHDPIVAKPCQIKSSFYIFLQVWLVSVSCTAASFWRHHSSLTEALSKQVSMSQGGSMFSKQILHFHLPQNLPKYAFFPYSGFNMFKSKCPPTKPYLSHGLTIAKPLNRVYHCWTPLFFLNYLKPLHNPLEFHSYSIYMWYYAILNSLLPYIVGYIFPFISPL